MGRYVISHRLAGKDDQQRGASRDALKAAVSSAEKVTGQEFSISPEDLPRRIAFLDADEKAIVNIRRQWPDDVIVEPELLRYTAAFDLQTYQRMQEDLLTTTPALGLGTSLKVTVRGSDGPMEGAKAMLFLQALSEPGRSTSSEDVTDAEGNARFVYDPASWVPALLAVEPEQGYWPWMQPVPTSGMVLHLPPLPKNGPIGWWHASTGMQQVRQNRGAGVRVGLIDTGVGPHPYLNHVQKVGSILGGKFDPGGGDDVTGHGSHVAGIIGARPVEGSGEYSGVAPGAEVLVVRVFPEDGGANQGDIAVAIQMLVDKHEVDLINMSLGSPRPSQIELDAIVHAAERGVVCIAAAGNAFGQLLFYPAGYPKVAAVTALGLFGQYAAGSSASYCVPAQPDRIAGYFFLANFSNTGAGVTCTAPGVGIISTVPRLKNGPVAAPYASKSGTSMASPVVTGCLAALLGSDPGYLELPRGPERAQRASAILLQSFVNIGLARNYVGGGLIHAALVPGDGRPAGKAKRAAKAEHPRTGDAKEYVMAKKPETTLAHPDWADRLAAIEGVEVLNASADRANLRATQDAIAKVHDQFANDFHIEEVAPRSTQQ